MLTPDQATIILRLVRLVLTFDHSGEIRDQPLVAASLSEVADAVAQLERESENAGGRAVVVELLGRVNAALMAGAIDGGGTPSETRLSRLSVAVTEVLGDLGVSTSVMRRRWAIRRGGAELDLPGWCHLEVVDALARIAEAANISDAVCPSALAFEIEKQAGQGARARVIIQEVGKLLAALDPDFDGEVTALAVELATRSVTQRTPTPSRQEPHACCITGKERPEDLERAVPDLEHDATAGTCIAMIAEHNDRKSSVDALRDIARCLGTGMSAPEAIVAVMLECPS
jgi:hypothetical protein